MTHRKVTIGPKEEIKIEQPVSQTARPASRSDASVRINRSNLSKSTNKSKKSILSNRTRKKQSNRNNSIFESG